MFVSSDGTGMELDIKEPHIEVAQIPQNKDHDIINKLYIVGLHVTVVLSMGADTFEDLKRQITAI